MLGYILFLVAYLLFLPLTIFNALNVRKKGYFLDTAINIDRFGNIDETISSVLGKNQRFGHLTKFGKVICKILDTINTIFLKSLFRHIFRALL